MASSSQMMADVREWFICTGTDTLIEVATKFAEEHADVFDIECETHKLEYTQLHLEFQALFEAQIDEFLSTKGYDKNEFERLLPEACRADEEIDSVAQMMLAVLEYPFFVQLMVEQKQALLQKGGQ
eukprot:GEMP01055137.1.p1 GENE.GEMP01055137.1~~GEMP01055137.1.p1  ORF type:complete len:126 (+),score=37.26 GEMP01055137.1:94-471(+)